MSSHRISVRRRRCSPPPHIPADSPAWSWEPAGRRSHFILRDPLKEWVEATDLEPYRQIGGRKIVEIALSTIEGYTPSDEIRDDYIASYDGDKFADTIPYVQAYPEQLPLLGTLLPEIHTPVRIVQGSEDQVVPAENAHYLGERLPNSSVDLIAGAGHFVWEERPESYAALVTDWWNRVTTS